MLNPDFRIALETEAVVKRESILNGVGSLAVILPLLYLVFRSVWLLVCGALPSSASLVVARNTSNSKTCN